MFLIRRGGVVVAEVSSVSLEEEIFLPLFLETFFLPFLLLVGLAF